MRVRGSVAKSSIVFVLTFCGLGGGVDVAFGQAAAAVSPKSCFLAPAKMSDAEITSFLAEPGSLLSEFSTAGLPMQTRVRSLAGSSIDTVDPLLALINGASKEQRAAIGSGLARAAKACASTDPEYAGLIQQKMLGVTDPEVLTAFLAASNEVQTAALGSGAGGSGGGGAAGISGGGNGGASSGGLNGDRSTVQRTSAFSFDGGSYTAGDRSVFINSPSAN